MSNKAPTVQNDEIVIAGVDNPVQKKTGKTTKYKRSNFHVTVNTNKRYAPNSEELKTQSINLKKAAKKMTKSKRIGNFIQVMNPKHIYSEKYVRNIKTLGAVERGSKYNQLHLHLGVSIKHRSQVRMNIPELRKWFTEKMGGTNVHVNVRGFPGRRNPLDILKNYINKNTEEDAPSEEPTEE